MASNPRTITIEDLYRVQFSGTPRIAPDGKRVAFAMKTIDAGKHEYRSSIWVVPCEGGEARRLTMGPADAYGPSWSPDGKWLAFVSKREGEAQGKDTAKQKEQGKGKAQIWLLPADGGEAQQLTFMQHGAFNPTWSPDSKRVIFNALVGPEDEENEDGKPLPKVRVIDRLMYRLDGVGYIYERRQHLFLMDIAGGEPLQLTDGDWDDNDAAWSPDGTRIAFSSDRSEERWRYFGSDLYVLSLPDGVVGELRCLTDGSRGCHSPSWSPDGKTIAFLARPTLGSANHMSLFTIAADDVQAAPTCLTGEFEGSCSDWTNSDMSDEHMLPAPPWSPDGTTLYVLAAQRGSTRVYAVPVSGAGTQPPTLTPGNIHVFDFAMDQSGDKVALLIEDSTHLAEIFVGSISAPGELRRITGFNDALLDELTLSTPEYLPYSGAEGWPMDGWVLKPPDFDPTKKYPLILEIHGGPNTQYGYGFFHEMQMLAASGYVVLYTNPRGSSGYGHEFAVAVRGEWGVKDSLDIMAGVDTLLQKGYIDEQRMGVTGGSYGGFMTSWLIGHTDRFKAAVADRSVINRVSFFGSSDIGWDFADDDMETTPWEDPERYIRLSPLHYVKQMHTPLLLIHSESDLRCNIEQAEQLFAALKYMKREVLFVRFEGQSHGLSRGGHPHSRLERLRHIKRWFDTYLQ
ncbi:MAG: S9 family peptidase [Ktedonobacteraceae bacterium]